MKAKVADEDGGVVVAGMEPVGVRPSIKSFLHQVITDPGDRLGPLGPLGLNGRRRVSALSRLIDPDSKKEAPGLPTKPKPQASAGSVNSKNARNSVAARRDARPAEKQRPPPVAASKPTAETKPAARPVARLKDKDAAGRPAAAAAAVAAPSQVPAKPTAPSATTAASATVTVAAAVPNGAAKVGDKQHEGGPRGPRGPRGDDWWRQPRERVVRSASGPAGATTATAASAASSLRREALVRKGSDADGRSRRAASPARKPSFKVAAHRATLKSRQHAPAVAAAVKVTIPVSRAARNSRVQALATKFNSMEEPSSTPPALLAVPSDIKIIVGNRAGVIRAVPPAIMDEVVALSSKIHHLQDLQEASKQSKVALVRKRPSFAKARVAATGNKVKAAVKIFEHGGEHLPPSQPQAQRPRPDTPTNAPAPQPAAPTAPAAPSTSPDPIPTLPPPSPRPADGANAVEQTSSAAAPTSNAIAEVPKGILSTAKVKRSQVNKALLKTGKTVPPKKLVVVNFDDDIDAIPPLPCTPPPATSEASASSSVVKDILDRAISPTPAADESAAAPSAPTPAEPQTPTPAEGEDSPTGAPPPALPARNPVTVAPAPTLSSATTTSMSSTAPTVVLADAQVGRLLDDDQSDASKLRANSSFLWRAAPPPPKQQPRPEDAVVDDGPSFRAVPAVVQPEASDGDTSADNDDGPAADLVEEVADELYDDVVPPSPDDGNENIYDDIGVDDKKEMYETCGPGNYDDCEGEGYQFVDSAAPAPCVAVEDEGVEENIYDDGDNIYDDVLSERRAATPTSATPGVAEDAVSTSGVYEAIYLVRPRGATAPPPRLGGLPLLPPGVPGRGLVGRHPSSCSSSSSSHSSSAGHASSYCGKMNSIYGEPLTDEQAMAVAAVLELPFQPGVAPGRVPLSETSDEWVDLDNTPTDQEDQDDEETIVVFRDQPRRRRGTSWSRKVRTQRTKSPRRRVYISSSSSTYITSNTSPDLETKPQVNGHVHTSPVQYVPVPLRTKTYPADKVECQEVTLYFEKEDDISTDSDNENPYESLYENPDAIDDIDSFDSDSDEDGLHHNAHSRNGQGISELQNGKLPDVPARENIYGVHVMRFKEAAGKKMQKLRKNWSLRKNDISNKLSRMRRKSSVDPRGAAILTVPQTSPPRTPVMEKSQSSTHLAGNKYWSFKSKFRRSQSTTASLGSTFYLTEEVFVGNESSSGVSQVDSNSTYTDSASPSSQRSGPPLNVPALPLPPRPPSAASQQNSLNERRNSSAMRPHSPPPPPPPVPKRNGPQKDKEKTKSSSSWYAECGLFDSSNLESLKRPFKEDPLNTSVYAEAGLWDNIPASSSPYDSSQSEHDTSQNTDFSDSSAGHSGSLSRPLFSDEPLYQFYNASVFEQARRQEAAEGDSDGYEEIVDGIVKSSRPSAMELIRPREGKHRTLWCEIPEVKESGVLDSLSTHEKKLQEAKFELITSEASYVKSLNVLEKHFMNSTELRDETILSKSDRRVLFSNVNPVRTRSEKFLADMEHCWQDSIMLQGICDIVERHASEYFNVYTKYCTNQIYLDRTLKKLREGDSQFSEALLHLESSPECQSLSLHSFLMLPMQRITRLPLLLVAVLNRLGPDHEEYHPCELALASLNKVVAECNEGARKMERYEEMMLLSRQLEFPQSVKPVPIISSARWLVRSGALTQLVWRNDDAKLTFGRKVTKINVHLFLFTDILVITKRNYKGSEENFSVIDYCPRNLVQMSSMEDLPQPQQLQLQPPLRGGAGGRHLILLTILQNQEAKTVEMVLSCGSESDRERWLAVLSPPKSEDPNEQLYEMWDCPQVRSEHPYVAQQPDELSLGVGDVVNVLRKTKDGWYEGERIRDREKGWFPANYTVEIASAHIRAKNLKQRYKLLVLSGSYLQESRSKNK